jgi:hypothetical protein
VTWCSCGAIDPSVSSGTTAYLSAGDIHLDATIPFGNRPTLKSSGSLLTLIQKTKAEIFQKTKNNVLYNNENNRERQAGR